MGKSRNRHVTLKDIAREVGVSAMTVSRSLSEKHDMVKPDTVERIRAAASRLGYTPNLLARSLRGEQLPTLVVFAEFISAHQYLAGLMDTVTRQIEGRDYSVITCQSRKSLKDVLRQFNLAGGVLLAPPESLFYDGQGRPDNALRGDAPLVVVHSAVEQSFLNEVSPDIEQGAFEAARHLVELGHRRVGFLGGPKEKDEPVWFELRRRGIQRALREAGLPPDALTYQPSLSADDADDALRQLLGRADVTGVMCINDEQALAVMAAARKSKRRVPEDLSVVGSNDIGMARFFSPALTTLAIDVKSLVTAGLEMLFRDIRNRRTGLPGTPAKVKQPCKLVIRESTAAPRAAVTAF